MATRLAVTPFVDRLAGSLEETRARLAGFEDLRDGMKALAHGQN
jgi:hypothetical protein